MNKFDTIYNECKLYTNFNTLPNDYVGDYNIFMTELEIQASKSEDYNSDRFNHFLLSWRWNAQQNQIIHKAVSKKVFLRKVYDAYNEKY